MERNLGLLLLWAVCFCLMTSSGYGAEPPLFIGYGAEPPLFISLGGHCLPAAILRHFEMRKKAFPFDWMLTIDDLKFIELIENDFEGFTDEKYLVKHPINGWKLVHSYYHLEFTHDWNEKYWENEATYSEEIKKVKQKYEKRIKRFQQLENYEGKVFFIRVLIPAYNYLNLDPAIYWFDYNMENNEREISLKLHKALKKRFPKLNFQLIVINKSPITDKIEMANGVTLFHLRVLDHHPTWQAIFAESVLRPALQNKPNIPP